MVLMFSDFILSNNRDPVWFFFQNSGTIDEWKSKAHTVKEIIRCTWSHYQYMWVCSPFKDKWNSIFQLGMIDDFSKQTLEVQGCVVTSKSYESSDLELFWVIYITTHVGVCHTHLTTILLGSLKYGVYIFRIVKDCRLNQHTVSEGFISLLCTA